MLLTVKYDVTGIDMGVRRRVTVANEVTSVGSCNWGGGGGGGVLSRGTAIGSARLLLLTEYFITPIRGVA